MTTMTASADYRPAYAADAAPEPGAAIEIAEGVFWVRMPLPFALDHINLWLLADGDGWAHVDTGIDRAETQGLWDTLYKSGALPGRRAERLICTHFHPDHFGLAGWFDQRDRLPLWMTRAEYFQGTMLRLDQEGQFAKAMANFFRRHGLSEDWASPIEARGNTYAERVALPPKTYRRIRDGEEIAIGGRVWQVIVGTGHAPEHACLYCPELNVLISGDQILPKITSNVSVWAFEPEADPLADFLNSFDRFRHLPEDVLILPSHGLPFRGLHGRLDFLAAHHDERLDELADASGDWTSAHDAVPVLFKRELDRHQMVFAMGEAIAHLAHLHTQGRVERETDGDGILRFRRR